MTPVNYTDLVALRDHLRAEAERGRTLATHRQRAAARKATLRMTCPIVPYVRDADWHAADARTATDAWLAADTRLRTLEALIAEHDRHVGNAMAIGEIVRRS